MKTVMLPFAAPYVLINKRNFIGVNINMEAWYAFQSKARKEQLLCEQLHMRGIETFFPCIPVESANRLAFKIKPYFPGYVFSRLDLNRVGRSLVDWIPGAIGIVSFGGEPATVTDELIRQLRQHIEAIGKARVGRLPIFQPGQQVTIDRGPFAGYEAIFDTQLPGRDRVEVLLKVLKEAQVRLELPSDQITSS